MQQLLIIAPDPEMRSRSAVQLTHAYIENDEAESIIEYLPYLTSGRSSARYDVEFNIALVRGGDSLTDETQRNLAMLLYQLALPKEKLTEWHEAEEKRLTAQRDELIAKRQLGPPVIAVNEQIRKIKAKKEALNEVPSYSEELRMRIARLYFEMNRKWEAMWAFWTIYKDFPKTTYSEQSLYAAFGLGCELDMRDRAIELGKTFMEMYPKSENFGEVTLNLGQLYLQNHDYANCLALFNQIFELKKDDESVAYLDKLMYLTGYAYFQDDQLDNAAKAFRLLRTKFPKSDLRDGADYWVGMTCLFQKDYQAAKEEFNEFLTKYKDSQFLEDATFRQAVSLYALGDFSLAKENFASFIRKFPDSVLRGEAHMFLGDIAAADGDDEEAILQYKEVSARTDNMVHIDYSVMQIGKIYEQLGEFQKMAEHFSQYLREYETKGNYTEAIYRLGYAKRSSGDIDGALQIYQDAITKYSNDPTTIGIDFIIVDWPQEYKTAKGVYPREIIQAQIKKAQAENARTAELRWRWAASKAGEPLEPGFSFRPEDLNLASPGTLVWMAEVNKDTNPQDAKKANLTVLKKYGTSEWILQPLKDLAEEEAKNKNYPKAVEYLHKIQEKFATFPDAAYATKREADFLKDEGKYKEAIPLYERILENKEWRGPIWPEAIYQIGSCYYAQEDFQKAFAFFQRIYVLYQGYPEWAAKGYFMSAQCLEKRKEREQAASTYRELLANKELETYPEYAKAKERLEAIQ